MPQPMRSAASSTDRRRAGPSAGAVTALSSSRIAAASSANAASSRSPLGSIPRCPPARISSGAWSPRARPGRPRTRRPLVMGCPLLVRASPRGRVGWAVSTEAGRRTPSARPRRSRGRPSPVRATRASSIAGSAFRSRRSGPPVLIVVTISLLVRRAAGGTPRTAAARSRRWRASAGRRGPCRSASGARRRRSPRGPPRA